MLDQTLIMLLALLFAFTIPFTLGAWLLSLATSSHPFASEVLPGPLRWLTSILLPLFVSVYGYRRGSVDFSGCVAGSIVAFAAVFANIGFSTSLLAFFLLGSCVTKYRSDLKRRIESDYNKSSRRNWIQALCNCGVAGQFAILYLIDSGVGGELPIDFQHRYVCSWLTVGVVSSVACACGDTFASEIGSVLSVSEPFLITTWRRVPRGTNGGISLIGSIASALGGFVIGLTYYVTILFVLDRDTLLLHHPDQSHIVWIGLFAGLFGSVIDSILGATLQYSGKNLKTGKVVEHPGPDVEWITGLHLLDNHSVNLLSTLIVGIVTPILVSQ